MNKQLKEYRDNFIENNFFGKEEVTFEEYKNNKPINENQYGYETINNKTIYYKIIPIELTDEEFDLYLKINNAKILQKIDKKQTAMKDIMIFWFVLTVIGIVVGIIMGFQISRNSSDSLGMILLGTHKLLF